MSKKEILKQNYLNKLRDSLYEKYYYRNRSVSIQCKRNVIYFNVRTKSVNLDYINDFINSIDKIELQSIFKKEMSIVVEVREKQKYTRKPVTI